MCSLITLKERIWKLKFVSLYKQPVYFPLTSLDSQQFVSQSLNKHGVVLTVNGLADVGTQVLIVWGT